jgi:putative transposase
MPSVPRNLIIDDQSIFHVTWQCHNKDWLLKEGWAKKIYYNLLLKFKDRYHIKIYSYCFMSNHPHLTGYCETQQQLSDFFRIVNSLFARLVNKRLNRRGQVVMDRFKSPKIESEADLERVMLYVDLNPNRARMVVHPKDYKWSSFAYYAYGEEDILITPSPTYFKMGVTATQRQSVYLSMIEEILRNDWCEKKPFSSTYFVGDPDWVKRKYQKLKEIKKEKIQKWRKRFKEKFLK